MALHGARHGARAHALSPFSNSRNVRARQASVPLPVYPTVKRSTVSNQ